MLTETDIRTINRRLKSGDHIDDVARALGCVRTTLERRLARLHIDIGSKTVYFLKPCEDKPLDLEALLSDDEEPTNA